jgi:hypothetical protein
MKKILFGVMMGVCGTWLPAALADGGTGPAGAAMVSGVTVRQAIAIGDPAPELMATDLKGNAVTLKEFRGKPVVVQFGSITDPIFRMHSGAVEKLAGAYADRVAFLIVYQKEAHPAGGDELEINVQEGFSVAEPASLEERASLASQAVMRLKIERQKMAVDAWNDTTSQRYGGLANMTFLIDGQGKLAAAYPWMDVRKLEGALDDVLAGKAVAEAHGGPVRSSGAAITTEFVADGYGPARFAAIIDNLHLTDEQKPKVFPILADYVGTIRTLRQGAVLQAGGKNIADTGVNKAASQPAPGEVFAQIRQATEKFKEQLKPVLTEAQYNQLVEGINRPFGGGGGGKKFLQNQ